MTEQLWLFELDAPGKPSRFWSGVEWIDSALEAVRFPDLEAARSYHDERFTGDTAVKIRGHTFGCGATLPTNINVSETQPHANKYVTSTAESSQSAIREIPDGWQMVPSEPTADMLEAMDESHGEGGGFSALYKAALAYAPPAPQPEGAPSK
jgi:hypothetical protein